MSREVASKINKEEESLPKSGAGSEYGRERREEARKRRRGYLKRTVDPDSAPWNLKIGGKGGRRYMYICTNTIHICTVNCRL